MSSAVPLNLLIIISGVSKPLYELLDKVRARFARTAIGESLVYSGIDSDAVLNGSVLTSKIATICRKKLVCSGHERYARPEIVNLVFVPSSQKVELPVELDFCFSLVCNDFSSKELLSPSKRAAGVLADRAHKLLSRAREAMAQLRQQLQLRDSHTPLLLPFGNFDNKDLSKLRDSICGEMTTVDGGASDSKIEVRLKRILNGLKSSITIHKGQGETIFVDGRGGRFKAPVKAGARHGFPDTSTYQNHPEHCLLRAHLRFGIPVDSRFHYDFTADEQQRQINRTVSHCHQLPEKPHKCRRLNIFPNDFHIVPASK